MHENNKKWLDDLRVKYRKNFKGARVLEVGAKDWNGSVRAWLDYCYHYGIDIEPGRFVDNAVAAKDYQTEDRYDTIFSLSVLEHDFEWRESLTNIVKFLKVDGMLFMCWGAEGNQEHNPPWAPVPHREVLSHLGELGFEVIDNFFEEDRYGINCAGCYNVIARKK